MQGGSSRHLRTAYLLTGNPADAEDLLQTGLSRLVRIWDRVAQSGDVDAYLRRVLVTAHVSRGRRRWHEHGEVSTLSPMQRKQRARRSEPC